LYDLNNFFSNVSTDTKLRLLEFNHLNENIYIMLENNNVVHKWKDFIQDEKEVLREFND